MTEEELDQRCGLYLTFRDLVEAGETWKKTGVANVPQQPDTMVALRRLAEDILDPVITKFGRLEVTYAFASPALTRHIRGRIDPARDQHAGHELRPDGTPVCPRLGQAADFRVDGACSGRIAAWIASTLPFDRMYFYGSDRPLHVSIGPQETRSVIVMIPGPSGRRVPRVRPIGWLIEEFWVP
jgi:hypothetical protein